MGFESDLLSGSVVFITGAGGGIGSAAVRGFVAVGATVVAGTRGETSEFDDLPDVTSRAVDVTDEDSVEAAIRSALKEHNQLDAAVNLAGILPAPAGVAAMPLPDWERSLQVNLTDTMLCVKHEMRAMAERGGSIVNVASSLGINMTRPNFAAYAVSKAGVHVLTEAAALEGAPEGIRVNTISPGPVATEMSKRPGETDSDRDSRAGATVALNRVADPREIVNTLIWLASPLSSFVTGHDLVDDGGQVLHR